MKRCDVLFCGLRTSYRIGGATRLIMFSMSTVEKAFSEPSAEMPSDSRKLQRAGRSKGAGQGSGYREGSRAARTALPDPLRTKHTRAR